MIIFVYQGGTAPLPAGSARSRNDDLDAKRARPSAGTHVPWAPGCASSSTTATTADRSRSRPVIPAARMRLIEHHPAAAVTDSRPDGFRILVGWAHQCPLTSGIMAGICTGMRNASVERFGGRSECWVVDTAEEITRSNPGHAPSCPLTGRRVAREAALRTDDRHEERTD